MHKFLKRFLSLILLVGMLATMSPIDRYNIANASVESTQNTLNQLNKQFGELERQQKVLQDKIKNAKNEKEKQIAVKNKTENEIKILKAQIDILIQTKQLMSEEMEIKQAEIESLQTDLDDNLSLFKDRFRAMYINDNSSMLGLVLGSDSYYDYLTKTETAVRIANHDKELMEDLSLKQAEVKVIQEELDATAKSLVETQASIEAKSEELDSILSKTNEQIYSLDKLEQQFINNEAQLQKQMKDMQAEIDEVFKQLEEEKKRLQIQNNEYVGGGFAYPIAKFNNRKITSYYGWRFGGKDFHTGIDIAGYGVNGKPVHAANAGTVIFTKTTYVHGQGYGKYAIIDHGGNYSTLYGHMQKIVVQKGQKVNKGDVIGYVGSTGWSTGPHLHFEIRINNKHTDPMKFLPRMD